MKRRAFLSKIALFSAVAPLAILGMAAEPAVAKTAHDDWTQRVILEPHKLSEGVAPKPYATVKVNSQFNNLPYVPYKIVVQYPDHPTHLDPLGQQGYVAYKYIVNGEMYGNFVAMNESYMSRMTDYDLNSLGLQLCAKELRNHGCALPMIASSNFANYVRD